MPQDYTSIIILLVLVVPMESLEQFNKQGVACSSWYTIIKIIDSSSSIIIVQQHRKQVSSKNHNNSLVQPLRP